MMVDLKGGWLYFKTDAMTADKGFDRLLEALEDAGIDVSYIEFGSRELRDEDGNTIDKYQANPYSNPHQYNCNHDCEALYEAYQKGKHDERVRILKTIKGGD